MAELRQSLPIMKDRIDGLIKQLLDRIRPMDRLALAGAICEQAQSGWEGEFGEDSPRGYSYAEYLMSIALVEPFPETPEPPTAQDVHEIFADVSNIVDGAVNYFRAQGYVDAGYAHSLPDGLLARLRLMLRVQKSKVRGDGYPQHTSELLDKLFALTDDFWRSHYGMNGKQALEIISRISTAVCNQVNAAMRRQSDTIFRLSEEFSEWRKGQDTDDDAILAKAYRESEIFPTESTHQEIGCWLEVGVGSEPYKYKPKDSLETAVADSLSLGFGENRKFWDVPNWQGWPLNASLAMEHPIVKHAGEYYVFLFPQLREEMVRNLARLIERKDKAFHREFLKRRGNMLESYALKLLETGLRPDSAAHNLFYPDPENPDVTSELDGLLVVDDTAVMVEAKGGQIRDAAKRGAPSLSQDIAETIGEGLGQAERAIRYIESREEAPFFDSDTRDRVVLVIKRRDIARKLVIIPTLDPVHVLGTTLPTLRSTGMLPGESWPWVVSILDLHAIVDLAHHPLVLMDYIVSRVALNTTNSEAVDELDYYALYLSEGANFAGRAKMFTDAIPSLTKPLDDFFYSNAGIINTRVDRPHRRLPASVEHIIAALESARPPGYLEAALALMDCGEGAIMRLSRLLNRLEKQALEHDSAQQSTFHVGSCVLAITCLPRGARYEASQRDAPGKPNATRLVVVSWRSPRDVITVVETETGPRRTTAADA